MSVGTTFDLDAGTRVLERTPGVLRTLLGGLPDTWVRGREGPDTWSPYDVVGHLVDGEETDWMPRARIILARGDDTTFQPFDRFRHLGRVDETLDERLDRFAELRSRNLTELRALGLEASHLRLTGTHPEFGQVTLAQLLATWVAHDLGHLVQINRTMAAQYRDAVGPWAAYLSVMGR